MKYDILKSPHAAGGYTLKLTTEKGNTKFGDSKKKAIIAAIQDTYSEGVYITTDNDVIKQLLNGVTQYLVKNEEINEYYFA